MKMNRLMMFMASAGLVFGLMTGCGGSSDNDYLDAVIDEVADNVLDDAGDNAGDDILDDVVDDVLDGNDTDVILIDINPLAQNCSQVYEAKYDVDGDRYYEFLQESTGNYIQCTYFADPNDQLMVKKYCEIEDTDTQIELCTYVDYYSDGTLGEVSSWTDGELDGDYVEHFPTGEVQIEGTYVDGLKHGTFTIYSEPNVLVYIEEWENGVRISVEYF